MSLNNAFAMLENMALNVSATHKHLTFIKQMTASVMAIVASITSSRCIESGQPLPEDIWLLYGESLNTDVASSKLKLASMHYCQGELMRAASVLQEVEFDLDDSIQHVCGCKRPVVRDNLSEKFCKYTVLNDSQEKLTKKVAFCVIFLREEKFCAPPFLWCEMYRAEGDDVDLRTFYQRKWMDWAEVDARPFLLYLQYLTYRGLGVRHRQMEAFNRLHSIITTVEKRDKLYHAETVLNLFGHCCELEGDAHRYGRGRPPKLLL